MKSESRLLQADFEKSWRKRFEEFAALRDDDAGIAGWTSSGLDVRFRNFVNLWQSTTHGQSWLDVGCGAGTYSRYLASRGARVVGLDYCLASVAKAKRRDTGNCCWAAADVTRLPLKAGGVDGVICFGVLQALTSSGPAIRELVAQVGEGGEVWIDALNGYCIANVLQRMLRWLHGKSMHLRYESPRRLKGLMMDAGLSEVRIHWIPILPAGLKALQPAIDGRLFGLLLRYVPGLGMVFSHSCLLRGVKR